MTDYGAATVCAADIDMGKLCSWPHCYCKRSSESEQHSQAATWPFPADVGHWRERALKAEARLAELDAVPSATGAIPWTPEETARRFHEAYEYFAPKFGYQTRTESAKPWAEVPESNKALMIAVVRNVLIEQAALDRCTKGEDSA